MIQPDLVHGQGSEYEAAICAARSGFPNVITLLGIMKEMAEIMNARPGSFYSLAARLENFALRRTRGVLANSRFTEKKLRGRTVKTWVVPNAVRAAFLESPPKPDSQGLPTLINVGTVCAYKRQNELLDVIEQLHKDDLKLRLEFAGTAMPEDSYAARLLSRLKGCSYAGFQGFKTMPEMVGFYDRASALVHVSQIETFGLVAAEALSRNLKFIGFNTGGVADIVSDVEEAESFSDGDWGGLKAALARWLRAGAPRPVTAAQTMRERYHPLVIARQHLEIYREVLGVSPSCRQDAGASGK
jgi:glycosyltransferase involved in cell wall biosynthesis